jgi:hypothetical protein
VGERGEMHTGLCCEDLRERDHLIDFGVEGRIILYKIEETVLNAACNATGSFFPLWYALK